MFEEYKDAIYIFGGLAVFWIIVLWLVSDSAMSVDTSSSKKKPDETTWFT